VELPFGNLRRVRHSGKRQRGWFLNRITTMYKRPWTVTLELKE
jgi:hypothetical protein